MQLWGIGTLRWDHKVTVLTESLVIFPLNKYTIFIHNPNIFPAFFYKAQFLSLGQTSQYMKKVIVLKRRPRPQHQIHRYLKQAGEIWLTVDEYTGKERRDVRTYSMVINKNHKCAIEVWKILLLRVSLFLRMSRSMLSKKTMLDWKDRTVVAGTEVESCLGINYRSSLQWTRSKHSSPHNMFPKSSLMSSIKPNMPNWFFPSLSYNACGRSPSCRLSTCYQTPMFLTERDHQHGYLNSFSPPTFF